MVWPVGRPGWRQCRVTRTGHRTAAALLTGFVAPAGGVAWHFAFSWSGDGVVIGKAHMNGLSRHAWMLAAMNMGLPPHERIKPQNMHVLSVIPDMAGTDVQSVLAIFADECAFLEWFGLQVLANFPLSDRCQMRSLFIRTSSFRMCIFSAAGQSRQALAQHLRLQPRAARSCMCTINMGAAAGHPS